MLACKKWLKNNENKCLQLMKYTWGQNICHGEYLIVYYRKEPSVSVSKQTYTEIEEISANIKVLFGHKVGFMTVNWFYDSGH